NLFAKACGSKQKFYLSFLHLLNFSFQNTCNVYSDVVYETHILHKYDGDLYGHLLKVCIVGYLRPERNFESLDDLISAIQRDIEDAKKLLDNDEEKCKLQHSKFFQANYIENEKSASTHFKGENIKNGS
ncbi:putative riboflavin kinase, partial [Ceratitis capitata]|uniref:putative riboflavin kinase n=1 Tax=Ceratitis capitata TaxID=7213 RepID=UPI000C6C3ABF